MTPLYPYIVKKKSLFFIPQILLPFKNVSLICFPIENTVGNIVYLKNNICYIVIMHRIPEEFKVVCNIAHATSTIDCYLKKISG